jgi:WD40 repeat protein
LVCRETGKLMASGNGHQNKVLGVAISSDGKRMVIVGVKFVKFLTIDGRALKGRSGVIGQKGKIQTFCSVVFVGTDVVVGTSSGELYRFVNRRLATVLQAHGTNDPVLALSLVPDTNQLVSGGREGLVITWDFDLKMVGSPVDMTAVTAREKGAATADAAVASVHTIVGFMLVGTRGGQIFELEMGKGSVGTFKSSVLMNSHSTGELWGLDTHPLKARFVTTGEGQFCMWVLWRLV